MHPNSCFYALFYAILVQVTEVVYSQNSKKQKCTLNTQMMHLINKKKEGGMLDT